MRMFNDTYLTMSLNDTQFDYLALSDGEDDSLSEIECDICYNSTNRDPKRVKCSECKHLACVHYSRKVLLTTLGERLPRWLCNECVHKLSFRCAQIKRNKST
jgi:hypothetical protein